METFIKIESGNGGDNAHAWARMLLEMYLGWARKTGRSFKVVFSEPGEGGGVKEATLAIECDLAMLAKERGIHRLVRVSPFDPERRRHTSFATVRVYTGSCIGNPPQAAEGYSQTRSYVLDPYKLVTDHRTGQKVKDADAVLAGDIGPFLATA